MHQQGAIARSERACAYSAAVIADAQASVMRVRRSIEDAVHTCTRARNARESAVHARAEGGHATPNKKSAVRSTW